MQNNKIAGRIQITRFIYSLLERPRISPDDDQPGDSQRTQIEPEFYLTCSVTFAVCDIVPDVPVIPI
jgi:hypothetical protein